MSYTKIDSLVARSKSGDYAAAGELLQLFLPKIYKLSTDIGNIDDRQDCVQDLSIAFLQGVKKFDENQGSPFNAFISRYLTLDYQKWLSGKYKRFNGGKINPDQLALNSLVDEEENLTYEDTLADTTVNVEQQALSNTQGEKVRQLVFSRDSLLSERERQVVYQHYWQSKPVRQIDCERRWGKDTAKSYLDRAIRKFKRSLIIEQNLRNT